MQFWTNIKVAERRDRQGNVTRPERVCRVLVTVDEEALASGLAQRAAENRTGRAVGIKGAVIAKVIK